MNSTNDIEKIKKDFHFFLSKSVKTNRIRDSFFFSAATVHNYMKFCESLSEYVERLSNNKYHSIFEIANTNELEELAKLILKDEQFTSKDGEKNINGLLSGALMYYVCFSNIRSYYRDEFDSRRNKVDNNNEVLPLQQIYYGAPGTGKSHEVKKQTGELSVDNEDRDLPNVFRTTFHPDTDYASFVGCYKPSMRKTGKKHQVDGKDVDDEEIIYEFVPQTFTDAYVYAYKNPTESTYLVIEEINRGNCAQIFGDLFQLLDRKNGVSEYRIKADKDLAKFLNEELGKDADGIKDGKLCLPANLNILATMNTSDQSLFPIDSAFKRRWEWKYIPIDTKKEAWSIAVDGVNYSWTSFLEIVNERVFRATSSEDKQLGFYFCKAQNNVVSAETFVSKVLFYLWNDVFKDYDEGESIFKDAESAPLPFSKFYKTNGNVDTSMVDKLLTALKVENDKKADASGEAEEA